MFFRIYFKSHFLSSLPSSFSHHQMNVKLSSYLWFGAEVERLATQDGLIFQCCQPVGFGNIISHKGLDIQPPPLLLRKGTGL